MPLSVIVALSDLQALPGLQQQGGENSSGWAIAVRGSLALDTSDNLEVRGNLCCTLCSQAGTGMQLKSVAAW